MILKIELFACFHQTRMSIASSLEGINMSSTLEPVNAV